MKRIERSSCALIWSSVVKPGIDSLFWIQYIMELTFTQAAKGVNKEISVNIDAACQRCDGKGHEPGSKVQRCPTCSGSGMVRTPGKPRSLQSVVASQL